MPSENTTTIDRIYEAFETREFLTLFSLLSPTIKITQCDGVPWGGVFHGLEKAKVFFHNVNATLENHDSASFDVDRSNRRYWLMRPWNAIASRWRRWRHEHAIGRSIAVLAELDDRLLRDIGIHHRSESPSGDFRSDCIVF
jgi:uncharacterized protein YjiS (DUF1127 family)